MANTPFVVFAQSQGDSAQLQNAAPESAGNIQTKEQGAPGNANQENANVTLDEKGNPAGNDPQQVQPAAPGWIQLFPFIILIVVMILISVRTSSKEKKKREQMMNSIRKGTKIMTSGGIIGEIAEVQQDQFLLKIANNVQIAISRAAVAQVISNSADDAKAEVTKK